MNIKHQLLYNMQRIRLCELEIAKRYDEWEMRCPTHLSVGQEATPAALQSLLRTDDLAVSGHRAHAHYLAKGGDLNAMIAEIYGKETGCSKGKGGSMHLVDMKAGFMGSTAIVGNAIPIGVGLALSQKQEKSDAITIVFLGDAAIETGAFYESANFAVLKNLPVLFICENNLYSVYTPLHKRQPKGRELYEIADGIGLKTNRGDGNDVLACYDMLNDVINKMRQQTYPYFVELSTYRWLEHCGPNEDDDLGYRPAGEYRTWRDDKDPIYNYITYLKQEKLINDAQIKEMEQQISIEIEHAFTRAKNANFPNQDNAYQGLYI